MKSSTSLLRLISKPLLCLFISCLGSISNTQSQTLESRLCSHAWQQRPIANIIWEFHENGTFAAMYVLIGKKSKKIALSGVIFKKGTFTVNDSAKALRIRFDSSYIVYSFDSTLLKKDTGIQDWQFIEVTNNKIVLRRPPVWDFEKQSLADKDEDIIVTMDGGKKRKNRRKPNP